MNKILSTLAAVLLTSMIANAGQEASQSSKASLGVKLTPSASGSITPVTMPCAMCKIVSVTVNEQITTKLSGGTVAVTRLVDQCPRCSAKLITTNLKQTQMVHTCGGVIAKCCNSNSVGI